MKRHLGAALFAATLLATPALYAQSKAADAIDMQVVRDSVRADRRAYVASLMSLTDAEAAKFWPAYDLYQRSLDAANRRRAVAIEGVIGTDKPMTDGFARILANELMATDEVEVKARRTMQNRVMKALPARKAARYLQLESKIRAVQAFDIAATIPLVK